MTISASRRIFTFYSYKGGTGRSMALANVAWILASNGKRVMVIDWDLEAPGVHRYFAPFLVDATLRTTPGLIDFVADFAMETMTPPPDSLRSDWYKSHADITEYAYTLRWPFQGRGAIDLVPAGQQGTAYGQRVNAFGWENFYKDMGGKLFFEEARRQMLEDYDYVLIDSRTGVSDTSGICTVDMPDVLVSCFTLNNQGIEGAADICRKVIEKRGADRPVEIFPVPMRVDDYEKERMERRLSYAKTQFADLAPDSSYWGEVEVRYIPYYAYEEILAAFGDEPGRVSSALAAFERLTGRLTHGDVTKLVPPSASERAEVTAKFGQTASDKPIATAASRSRWRDAIVPAGVAAAIVALIWIFATMANRLTSEARLNAILAAAVDAANDQPGANRVAQFNPLLAALLMQQLPERPAPSDGGRAALAVLGRKVPWLDVNLVSQPTVVEFTPDAKLVAVAFEDNVIRLWDVESGSLAHELVGHTAWITAMAFDDSGRMLATSSLDGTIRWWDVRTNTVRRSESLNRLSAVCYRSGLNDLRFSPSGDIWGLSSDAIVISTAERTYCKPPTVGTAGDALSDDGRTVVSLLKESAAVRLVDLESMDAFRLVSLDVRPGSRLIDVDGSGARAVFEYESPPRQFGADVFDLASRNRLTTPRSDSGADSRLATLDWAGQRLLMPNERGLRLQELYSSSVSDYFGAPTISLPGVVPRAMAISRDGRYAAKAISQASGPAGSGHVYVWRLNPPPVTDGDWQTLRNALQGTTRACLSAPDREKYLGELPELATSRTTECLRGLGYRR